MLNTNNKKENIIKINEKVGIFLAIFSFLFIATFLYFYLSKPEPISEPIKPVVQKTEEEKVKEDVELIKQGYVKSISGTIKEISENKIVVSTDAFDESKISEVSVDDKTIVSKTIYTSEEVVGDEQREEEYIEENPNNFQEKVVSIKGSDLKVGDSVEIIFPKFVKLEENSKLVAQQIHTFEEENQNK